MGEAQDKKAIVVWGVIAAGAVLIYTQTSDPEKQPKSLEGAGATKVTGSVDEDAQQVVRALRRWWAPAQKATALRRAHDKCEENEKGYKSVLDCWSRLAREANQLEASIGDKPETTNDCSLQFENAAITHVAAVRKYLDESARWLEARDAAFQRKLGSSTLSAFCTNEPTGRACLGILSGWTREAKSDDYAQLDCTYKMFQCGFAGTYCKMGGVAQRLGLNEEHVPRDEPTERLRVRATGKRIFPDKMQLSEGGA